jgi:hypothetical protein
MRKPTSLIVILPLLWGCGGQAAAVPDAGGSGGGSSGGSSSGSGGSSGSGSGSGSTSGSSSGTISGSSSSGGSSGSNGGGSTSSSSSGGGADAGRVPVNHRTGDGECSTTPPPGQCQPTWTCPSGDPSCCTSDSACTQGTNGRCNPIGPLPGCQCYYDACQHDTDCATGHACACHGTADTGISGNTCVPGNCRVDSDCGSGGYCSPSLNSMSCGEGVGGYYCHTPNDQCIDDTDCSSGNGLPSVCTYSTTSGRWECTALPVCAGVAGG